MTYRAPHEHEAGERAWEVVRDAYETREPLTWPRRHARPLVAGALIAAVIAAVLSPPGRSVVRSFRKAVGVERAEPALFSLPAPGQLLVTSPQGAWLVRADGSKRLLGRYRDATFSPHGLFIAATRENELVALDPKGEVRWTLARPGPRFPAWAGTRTDTRIAYLSAGHLHVVAGDGTGDRTFGPAAPVAPAWRPGSGHVLAYSDGERAMVLDADTRVVILRLRLHAGTWKLAWSSDGRLLLALAARGLRIFEPTGKLVLARNSESRPFVDAAFEPRTHRVVALREYGFQSEVVSALTGRVVFRGTGTFGQLSWAPRRHWLLVTWPTANQWVFLRTRPSRRIVGASRIASQFGGFARVSGWCCAR